MNPYQEPSLAASAATVLLLAAGFALVPADHPAGAAANPPATTLACDMEVQPGSGTRVWLTHQGGLPLPPGARVAWVTLGTPASQGEVSTLPEALPPGGSVTLNSGLVAHGAGCAAVVQSP
jgi:hypothetical protein